MPHLQLDYSGDLPIPTLIRQLTDEFCLIKTIDPASVKSYVRPAFQYVPGTGAPPQFVHLTICLLEGRSPETLQEISDRLYLIGSKIIAQNSTAPTSWTLEIREMDHPTYRKSTID